MSTFKQGNLGNWKWLRLSSSFAAVWFVFLQMFLANLLRNLIANNAAIHAPCFPFLLVCVPCCRVQYNQIYLPRAIGISNIYPHSTSFLSLFPPQTPRRIPRSDLSTLSHAKTRTLHIVSTKGNALWSKPWRDPTNTAGKSSQCHKTLLSEGGSIRKK